MILADEISSKGELTTKGYVFQQYQQVLVLVKYCSLFLFAKYLKL